jgi:outer membrane protein assembly factor BamB
LKKKDSPNMQKLSRYLVAAAAIGALSTPLMFSQGRGGGAAWNTAGADAERSSWLPGTDRISPSAMAGFQFLWKVKTSNSSKQSYSLSSAVMVDRYIGYRGFRSYAFLGGASNNAIALDTDLGRVEWSQNLGPASSAGTAACPGAMSAGVTRAAQFTPAVQGGGGAGRGGGGRGGGAQSGVGEPGAGAVTIGAPRPARGGVVAIGASGAAAGGRGGRGGRGAAGASGAALAAGGRGAFGASGRGGGGGGGRAPEAVYAVSTDGMLHTLYISNGENAKPPVRFLPANANASGLLLVENTLYAATSGNCGNVPNGIWMMEVANDTPVHWSTNGGGIAGTEGPAVGSDGTVFAATTDGDYSPTAFSDSVVALDGKTLALRSWFTPGKSEFTSSPVVFSHGEEKELVAVANKDGKLYLLDGADLGGSDHKTPLASAQIANASADAGALASWVDASGTRWILVPGNNGIAAFKVVDQGGKPTLQAGWVSPNIASPIAPIVVNGVVITAASGAGSKPAVLYALDGETGKELFNSGSTITAPVSHSGGLSGSAGQIYLGASDNTIYAFGVPLVSPALAAKQASN